MFFTPNPTTRYSGDKKILPAAEPMYTFPEGGQGVQPCTFMPNQPEPVKCGGVR
jgi:hypothetical protein